MAEILGVAASASQLGVACFSLIDVVRKIKGGASTLKRYHEQLQELQSLSTSISENPLLQTPEIGTQTDALLFTINNNCLNSLLRKSRVLRTWGFLYREQDLLDIFVRLERQKSNLSLAIEQIQSRALYQIQTDIQVMSEKKSSGLPAPEPTSTNFPAPLVLGEYTVFPYNPNTPGPAPDVHSYNLFISSLLSSNMSTTVFPNQPPPSHGDASTPSLNDPTTSKPMRPNERMPEPNSQTYNKAFAASGFNQRNGRVFEVDDAMAAKLSMNNPRQTNPLVYNNSTKLGYGDQHNGNVIEIDSGTDFVMPDVSGDTWNSPMALFWHSAGSGPVIYGTQHNGPIIRTKKTSMEKK
ncbi:uncharacterized protein BKA55DRAFT_541849 [Fusarium redolens]|uniref:Fungal N-terminal domain-containing protein n=1 Tax=Fusarium redolens TaxID=48865 RepID=A0A9P9K0G5_FUSRE|nr:uncharacterized protein BKA55DRAFT_541849 [Fusarium redolens]KAH7243598.1 hypothetical protein BKA55DRAFT_541849 [Fusarium redolens]